MVELEQESIEEALGTEMVWIVCRHHLMEVGLSNVFTSLFGPTEGPSAVLIKRFQKKSMYQDAYCTTTASGSNIEEHTT